MTNWQSINTAPKDGTVIIVGNEYGSWAAKYEEVYQSGFRPSNPWQPMMLNMKHLSGASNYKPDKWMPLPDHTVSTHRFGDKEKGICHNLMRLASNMPEDDARVLLQAEQIIRDLAQATNEEFMEGYQGGYQDAKSAR